MVTGACAGSILTPSSLMIFSIVVLGATDRSTAALLLCWRMGAFASAETTPRLRWTTGAGSGGRVATCGVEQILRAGALHQPPDDFGFLFALAGGFFAAGTVVCGGGEAGLPSPVSARRPWSSRILALIFEISAALAFGPPSSRSSTASTSACVRPAHAGLSCGAAIELLSDHVNIPYLGHTTVEGTPA